MNKVSTKDLFKIWSYVAANSFGGPAGQIAVIHQLVVEDKKLISEKRFLHALNFCMLLPGPEAQQLATYMGWLMAKWRGGVIAGGLFILPGFLSILLLSYLYAYFNNNEIVQGLFYGIKPAIIAIVLSALYRISKKSLNTIFYKLIAAIAFCALYFFQISFPVVVLTSGLVGIFFGKYVNNDIPLEDTDSSSPNTFDTLKTFLIWIFIWFFPILITVLVFGEQSNLHKLNIFFSKMSLVTFGGAYAALSYVAQQGVEVYGWLQGAEMLDGLALAETTPGPLIQVVQYVGFMASFRFPGTLAPGFSAFLGSILTTWMTFAPCFLFIFTLGPYIEFIRGKKIFSDALATISASVVGVIFNLSIWFVVNSLFQKSKEIKYGILQFKVPVLYSLDLIALLICIIALVMQFKFKSSVIKIIGVSIILGILGTYLK